MWRWMVLGGLLTGCDALVGLPPGTIPQLHDGEISVFLLDDRNPAISLQHVLDEELGEPVGKVFARPPLEEDDKGGQFNKGFVTAAPDVPEVFLERWVFRTEGDLLETMQRGFAMTWVGMHSAACDDLTDSVTVDWRAPQFAEQLHTYSAPTVADAPIRGATMQTFEVYQPDASNEPDLRGWMLRLRGEISGLVTYQDHWLLHSSYEPLGTNQGDITLVVWTESTPRSVQAWMDQHTSSNNALDYTSATYSLAPLLNRGSCVDASP